jgi:hypothetical protein
MLDVDQLEKPRLNAGNLIARCPACAEMGADKSCEHLFIADEGRGRFGCIIYPGPTGEAHRKRIWQLAGKPEKPGQYRPLPVPRSKPTPKPAPCIPPLRKLTVGEMEAIAHLRGWPLFAGLELLTQRGMLWFGMVWDDDREWPAWIITDDSQRNAQARRLDGQLWHGIGDKKAKSLPGSDPHWPIGASAIGDCPIVLFCEGQPDFCAALLVAWWEGLPVDRVTPVCMTGAGNSIHPDALQMFAGKRVRIAVHSDNQGREAGERWARQLYAAGATRIDGFHFDGLTKLDGQPVEDLADFATLLDPESPPATHVLADLAMDINDQKQDQP